MLTDGGCAHNGMTKQSRPFFFVCVLESARHHPVKGATHKEAGAWTLCTVSARKQGRLREIDSPRRTEKQSTITNGSIRYMYCLGECSTNGLHHDRRVMIVLYTCQWPCAR